MNRQPPWIIDVTGVILPKSIHKAILPSRLLPAKINKMSSHDCWEASLQLIKTHHKFDEITINILKTPHDLVEPAQDAITRIKENRATGSFMSDVILFCFFIYLPKTIWESYNYGSIMDYFVLENGLEYATEVFLMAQLLQLSSCVKNNQLTIQIDFSVSNSLAEKYNMQYSEAELCIGKWLSIAENDIFSICQEKLINALSTLHYSRKPLIALLLPDREELAIQLAKELIETDKTNELTTSWLALLIKEPSILERIAKIKLIENNSYFPIQSLILGTLLYKHKEKFEDILLSQYPDHLPFDIAKIVLHLGSIKIIKRMLGQIKNNHKFNRLFKKSMQLFPLPSLVAILEILVRDDTGDKFLIECVDVILASNKELIEPLSEWLNEKSRGIIQARQHKFISACENDKEELMPEFLLTPPWEVKQKKIKTIFSISPFYVAETLDLTNIANFYKDSESAYKGISVSEEINLYQLLNDIGVIEQPTTHPKPSFNTALKALEENDIDAFVQALKRYAKFYPLTLNFLFMESFTDAMILAIFENLTESRYLNTEYALKRLQANAIVGLKSYCINHPLESISLWQYIGTHELAVVAARMFFEYPTLQSTIMQWCEKYLTHAISGLLPLVLGENGVDKENATLLLKHIEQQGHIRVIKESLNYYHNDKINLAIDFILKQNPLDIFPAVTSKMPFFWHPDLWAKPRLKGTGGTLNNKAINNIGIMLQFPTDRGIYPGFKLIRSYIDEDSLAAFAWDLYQTWKNFKAQKKYKWAFKALGLLGNEQSLFDLYQELFNQPIKAIKQHILIGLEIFELNGSDTAIALLEQIKKEQKLEILKEKASFHIDNIMRYRGIV